MQVTATCYNCADGKICLVRGDIKHVGRCTNCDAGHKTTCQFAGFVRQINNSPIGDLYEQGWSRAAIANTCLTGLNVNDAEDRKLGARALAFLESLPTAATIDAVPVVVHEAPAPPSKKRARR